MIAFSSDEIARLRGGGFVDIGNKRYGVCQACRSVIRVNKPIFGSAHVCDSEETP